MSDTVQTDVEEIDGRNYLVRRSPDAQEGAFIIIGPPQGLVDELGLPEPFATKVHNILFNRRIFTFKDISGSKIAYAVLQEAYQVDAQKLTATFLKFEK